MKLHNDGDIRHSNTQYNPEHSSSRRRQTISKMVSVLLTLIFLTTLAVQPAAAGGGGPSHTVSNARSEPTNIDDIKVNPPGAISYGQSSNTVMSSCAPATGTTAIPFPPGGKTATVAFLQEPDLLSGLFSSMSYAAWVAQSVLVGLGTWDSNNNLVPELATVIPTTANGGISSDGLTITWHLKPCLYWSDGQPLTSADVKFTWQVEMDPSNAVWSRVGYDQISSIDTPDDITVVLHFGTLYPGWQTLFTSGPNNQGNIQPQHILTGKTHLESDPFTHWPTISSGPWIITDWIAGDHLVMLPNPNYWKGHPKLDQIQIKFLPDPATEKAALQAGTVDFVPDFSESDLADLPALEPAIHTRADAGPEFEHYFFNLGVKGTGVGQSDVDGFCPFKNVNVRKAIILGIDRQTILNTLLFGKTTVPASLWEHSSWFKSSLTPYPYDPTQAATLLQNAGYTPGLDGIRHGLCGGVDTKLSFNFETTTRQLRQDMANAVKTMLAGIGVEFKPIFTPAGTFFGDYASGANMATGNYDMAGYTTGFYPDPYTDGFLCSTVPSAQNQGGYNNYHICDPSLDTLFGQANSSADPIVRKGYFDQIQQYMYDGALVIPMYSRMNVMAYVDRFTLPSTSVVGGMLGDTFDWDVLLTPPGAFSKTLPFNTATGQLTTPTLSWGASSGAASYKYCIDTSNNSACNTSWISTGTTTHADLSGLIPGTTYYWQTRAVNLAGSSYADSGTWWSFTVTPLAPGAFSKTTPTNAATGQATNPTLTWAASSGATSYRYCIDTSNNDTCNTSWISTGTITHIDLSGLTPGTTYYWQVRALNSTASTYANGGTWWSFQVAAGAPGSFSKSSPANAATGQVTNPTLTWVASSGATSYRYCIDTSNNSACNASWISTGTTTHVDLSGLTPGATYYWQVRAINATGSTYANASTWWSFQVAAAAPGSFSKTSPADTATGQATNPTLTWAASSGATSYRYCIDPSNNSACNAAWISTGTTTHIDLTGLPLGVTLYWQVRAINASGSTYANSGTWWSFKVGP